MMKTLLCAIALPFFALAFAQEICTQTTETGGKTTVEKIQITRSTSGENERIDFVSDRESRSIIVDAGGQVLREEGQGPGGSYLVERNGDSLRITGSTDGKSTDRTINLKGRPYYGIGLEWSSRALVLSGGKSLIFWMYNLTGDKTVEMELRLQDKETINGREGYRIRIGLTGILAPFWSATEWVTPDGLLLRYVGNSGPGTVDTVINFSYGA